MWQPVPVTQLHAISTAQAGLAQDSISRALLVWAHAGEAQNVQ
jgi:hypothetical protein